MYTLYIHVHVKGENSINTNTLFKPASVLKYLAFINVAATSGQYVQGVLQAFKSYVRVHVCCCILTCCVLTCICYVFKLCLCAVMSLNSFVQITLI